MGLVTLTQHNDLQRNKFEFFLSIIFLLFFWESWGGILEAYDIS